MRPRRPRTETYHKGYSSRAALGATNYLTTVTGGGLVLPSSGLVFKALASNGLVDTIGKSIAEVYPLTDPALRSIISADGGATKRDDAEIVTLALASPLLNGSTMCGSAEEGIVFYNYLTIPVAAPATVLTKACRCLGATYTPPTGPDQFTITDQTGVELSTLTTSAPVTVEGLLVSAAISVTGGAYRLNGAGDFVATPGIWSPGDTFEAQRLADDDYETTVNAVVSINGVSDTFAVTTKQEATPKLIFDTKNNTLNDSLGVGLAYSTAAGQVPNLTGGVQSSSTPPVDVSGFYAGGAFTNLSSTPDAAAGGSINTNQTDAFGGSTAIALVNSEASESHFIYSGTTNYVSGTTYTFSALVKAGTQRYIQLTAPGAQFVSKYANFDLQDGVVGSLSAGSTSSITSYGNGWFLVSWTVAAAANGVGYSNMFVSVPAATSVRLSVYSAGAAATMFSASNFMCVASAYQYPCVPRSQSIVSTIGTSTGNGVSVPLSGSDKATALGAAFSGGAISAVVPIKFGASSAQITADTNLVAVKNAVVDFLYVADGGVFKSTDSAGNTASVTVASGWTRYEKLTAYIKGSGATFKIGYRKYGESSITWGTPATFSGSFSPDTLRLAYTSAVPNTFKGVLIYSSDIADATLLADEVTYV